MNQTASNSAPPGVASGAEHRRFALCKRFAQCASLSVLCLGAAVLAGWLFDIEWLKRLHPDWVTMKANSAFCFILAGLAVWWVCPGPATGLKLRLVQACALTIALVGLLTLGEYLFSRDLGIDHLLFREHEAEPRSPTPGRMAPVTAFNFVLLGMALVLLDVKTSQGRRPAQYLSLAAAAVTLFGFVGYFYDVEAGYWIVPIASVAFHTIVAFVLCCLGILFARPDQGVMTVLTSDRGEGVVTRRMLPAALLLPVLLGWLERLGHRAGFYGPGFGSALLSTSLVVILGSVIWKSATALNRIDTERLRAEEARLRLAAAVELSDDAIIGKDLNGIIGSWNHGAERIFGYGASEVIGHPISMLIPPGNVNEEPQILERLRRGERIEHYETVRRRKNGTLLDVSLSISPVKDSDDKIIGALKIARDITEQKRSQESLRRSEEHFRVTLASIGDGVIVTDGRAHVTFMNPVAEHLTGYTLQEAHGVPLPTLFRIVNESTREPVEIPVDKVLQKGVVVGLANDTVLIAKDGTEHPILDSAAPVRNAAGELTGVVLVFRDVTDQRAAQLATRRLAAIVESSDDAIIGKNLNGTITSWNQGAERIFGYTAAEAVDQSILMLIPTDRVNEEQKILEQLRKGERTEHFETVRKRKDGTLVDVSLSVSPIKDSRGKIIGASKIARDITRRRQDEEAVRQNDALKAAILDSTMDAILSIDSGGKIHEWNKAATAIFGYPKAGAVGRRMEELIIPPDQREYYQNRLAEYLMTGVGSLLGRPFESTLIRADGTEFYGELAITRNSQDEPTQYTCIVRDITDRKLAEADRVFLAAIVESSTDSIISKDLNGIITSWNEGAERMFGYKAQETIGQAITLIVPPERRPEEEQILARVDRGERIDFYETIYRRKDGALLDVSIAISPLKDSLGRIVGDSRIARDITERKRTEEKLRQSETSFRKLAEELEIKVQARTAQLQASLNSVEDLLYTIAHDLRAPNRAMQGCAHLLQMEYGDRLDDTARDYVNRISTAAVRNDELIRDLLEYGRLSHEDVPLTPVDLRKTVESVLSGMEGEIQQRRAHIHLGGEWPVVMANERMLRQIVTNLLTNALIYVPQDREPDITIAGESENSKMVLRVKDNGIGISPEQIDRAFKPFIRLPGPIDAPGTGMGLAIVKKAAERMNAAVGADSTPGKGTCFRLELPTA
ncbi:MAG TPA: PAS domain S-box protein [Verrucomicrobiae bacterium]|nr:PAS domain S-box protein [Verrucomicrobiae bacterium]